MRGLTAAAKRLLDLGQTERATEILRSAAAIARKSPEVWSAEALGLLVGVLAWLIPMRPRSS